MEASADGEASRKNDQASGVFTSGLDVARRLLNITKVHGPDHPIVKSVTSPVLRRGEFDVRLGCQKNGGWGTT